MAERYKDTGRKLAQGERSYFLAGDRRFVRTGIIATRLEGEVMSVTYRLREVYSDAEAAEPPTQEEPNTPPTLSDGTATVTVEPRK